MPGQRAVGADEGAPFGLWDPAVAAGAGRRGAPLVDQLHGDAGQRGFVGQVAEQVGAIPGPQPAVMHRPEVAVADTFGVTDDEGADPMGDGPLDDQFGGVVLAVTDPAAMARVGFLLGPAGLTPPPGAAPAGGGGSTGDGPGAGLGVGQMQVVFGSRGPARDHQGVGAADHGVGVDDAHVDPGHPGRVEVVDLDGDLGADVDGQAAAVDGQGNRAHLGGRVGDRTGQP